MSDVVELVTYHTSMSHIEGFKREKARWFTKNFPAWTAISTPGLVEPSLKVEIRATAIIGSGANGPR